MLLFFLSFFSGRTWSVTYQGEGGTDAGGLFRDSLSSMCHDLQSPWLQLLIPSCNAAMRLGDNQEKVNDDDDDADADADDAAAGGLG